MRRPLLSLCLLLLACPAYGQSVKLPAEVKGEPGMILVAAETDSPDVQWWAPDGGLQVIPSDLLKNTKTAVAFSLKPGRYRLVAIVAKGDKSAYAVTTVVVGDPPPGPGPGPNPPPDPGPTPGPAPIPLEGFRVLIVYESAEASKLPAAQQSVLYGKSVRDYLNSKCAVGPDGKTKEWRIYDKDVDLSGESKTWQDAMKRPRSAVPWVIISNGKSGFEGPLPSGVDEAIKLFKKYGGE